VKKFAGVARNSLQEKCPQGFGSMEANGADGRGGRLAARRMLDAGLRAAISWRGGCYQGVVESRNRKLEAEGIGKQREA